jgi:hypothetical protein
MGGSQALGRRLRGPFVVLLTVGAVGILGYVLIEGWSASDAVYMVAISVTTVGFREVHPLSPAGQWFTAGIVVAGLASTWYMLSVTVAVMVDGELVGTGSGDAWNGRSVATATTTSSAAMGGSAGRSRASCAGAVTRWW